MIRSVPADGSTPAYYVTDGGELLGVYVGAAFTGTVGPVTGVPGLWLARDAECRLIVNPRDTDGLWADERAALDAVARRGIPASRGR